MLSPSQARALAAVRAIVPAAGIVVLRGNGGHGKSTVLRAFAAAAGGTLLGSGDVLEAMRGRSADRLEEAVAETVATAFRDSDLVLFDDFEMLGEVGGHGNIGAGRSGFLSRIMAGIISDKRATNACLVISTNGETGAGLDLSQAASVELDPPGPADLAAVLGALLGQDMADFQSDRLKSAFRRLSFHEIAVVARMLAADISGSSTTEGVIATLNKFHARSNVDLTEVEAVSLDGLVGVDDIVRTLRRTILLPMTEPALAGELGLAPKRGVLLYGAPGTGKTTIGRALAHDMKGHFFMIDGTFVPTAPDFEPRVDAVLAAAEASGPSVLFIDDADVIFRHGQQPGFARKLLTKLDGIESASQANVCIVMTAMDIADMPPALLRSGRVEVWLEMRLPDARKRLAIVRHYARGLPFGLEMHDEEAVAAATEHFTPADLRGLVGDARGHFAYDRHKGRPVQSFDAYLIQAAAAIARRRAIMSHLAL
jgi:AAA+ superfamily predicted ATPase